MHNRAQRIPTSMQLTAYSLRIDALARLCRQVFDTGPILWLVVLLHQPQAYRDQDFIL